MINTAKKILVSVVASMLLTAGFAGAASKMDLSTNDQSIQKHEKDFGGMPPCMGGGSNGGG
jgi:outer membrane biogenesis lipoprotein LolB